MQGERWDGCVPEAGAEVGGGVKRSRGQGDSQFLTPTVLSLRWGKPGSRRLWGRWETVLF